MLSVISQGSLIVPLAKRLDLIDSDDKPLKTFAEYAINAQNELLEVVRRPTAPFAAKAYLSLGCRTICV